MLTTCLLFLDPKKRTSLFNTNYCVMKCIMHPPLCLWLVFWGKVRWGCAPIHVVCAAASGVGFAAVPGPGAPFGSGLPASRSWPGSDAPGPHLSSSFVLVTLFCSVSSIPWQRRSVGSKRNKAHPYALPHPTLRRRPARRRPTGQPDAPAAAAVRAALRHAHGRRPHPPTADALAPST